jgi:plasmid stabilization system protein ParE
LSIEGPVIFTRDAQSDIVAAQDWYEAQASGLGARFREELGRAVQRIADNPLQFPEVYRDIRRALVNRFPYALFFVVAADAVTVIACFHSSRDPHDWRRRRGH